MAKLGWAIGLALALGLVGAAACPPGLPVTKVYSTGEGIYGVWIHNCAPVPHNTFKLVFAVPVGAVTAVAINGTAVQEIKGADRVWIVKLAGAGVEAGGYLVLTVKGVSPAGEATPLNVYPWPDPCCAFGTYWDCVATWDPYWGLTEMYCKINWAWCYGSDPLCPAPGYYEWIDYCLGICYY